MNKKIKNWEEEFICFFHEQICDISEDENIYWHGAFCHLGVIKNQDFITRLNNVIIKQSKELVNEILDEIEDCNGDFNNTDDWADAVELRIKEIRKHFE